MPDGRVRVYYIGWSGPEGPYVEDPGRDDRWRILSTTSEDGLDFARDEGIRIDVAPDGDPPHGAVAMAKPQLVRLEGGGWRMYYGAHAEGGTFLFSATSNDGLTWEREPGIRVVDADGNPVYAKYPSLVRTADGRLRLYYDGNGGVRSAVDGEGGGAPATANGK